MYRKCEYCGASLDPQEKCDCREPSEQNRRLFETLTRTGEGGQMVLGGLYYGREHGKRSIMEV